MSGERCGWVTRGDALYEHYHDTEWGVPVRDGKALFGLLALEMFQAGLSWITILRKREAFLAAFAGFDPFVVARFDASDVERLMGDAGIVRSRAKIEAVIAAARAFEVIETEGGFATFIWDVVGGVPVQNTWASFRDAPARTPQSEALSAKLKARGIKFCGPVIAYAFMQAAGLVNDHETGCPRWTEVRGRG